MLTETNSISAKSWILMDLGEEKYLRGYNTQNKRQIASLTKMYTLYACLTINDMLKIIFATNLGGTTADLLPGHFISLFDLYYALMLPSGNDAAFILACYYGNWLIRSELQTTRKIRGSYSLADTLKIQLYYMKFIQFINKSLVNKTLGHKNTHFENSHGLCDRKQTSTAQDLGDACILFMKNKIFRQICCCQKHRGTYFQSQEQFQWNNTNQLLRQGYEGLKTGFTFNAGGCLASLKSVPKDKYTQTQLLVIVLGSDSCETRFQDTKTIIQDYQLYLRMMQI